MPCSTRLPNVITARTWLEALTGRTRIPSAFQSESSWAIWFAASPLVALFVWWGLRQYRSGAAYAALPGRTRGVVLAIVALISVGIVGIFAYSDLLDGYPALAAAQLSGILAFLWLRAGNAGTSQV